MFMVRAFQVLKTRQSLDTHNPTDSKHGRTAYMGFYKRLTIVLGLLCMLPIATLAQTEGTPQNSPPPLGKLIGVGGYRVHRYCSGTGSPTFVILGAEFSFTLGLVQPQLPRSPHIHPYH